MKKLAIIFLCVFTMLHSFAATECLIDTFLRYSYIPGTSTKVNKERRISKYNANNLVIEELIQDTTSAPQLWENLYKTEKQYNSSNLLTQNLFSIWNQVTAQWEISEKRVFIYSTAGKVLEDSVYRWKSTLNSLQVSRISLYSYNSLNLETFNQNSIWDDVSNQLEDIYRRTQTYSGVNRVILLEEVPISGVWDTASLTVATYNSKNKVIYEEIEDYQFGGPYTKNKIFYTYDLSDTLISELIREDWVSGGSPFLTGAKRTLYVYDANKNLISEIDERLSMSLMAFVNYRRELKTYNVANKVIDKIVQYWNTTSSSWVNYQRNTYTLNSLQQPIEKVYFDWVNHISNWRPYTRYLNTYNANQDMTRNKREHWDTLTNKWENGQLDTMEYNSANQQISIEYLTGWDDLGGFYTNSDGSRWTCKYGPNSVSEIDTDFFNMFPNPLSTDMLHIYIEKETKLELSDIQGKIVFKKSLSIGENTIEVGNLQSGLYLVKVGNSIQKLIKQ